jgi:hypothetical protein
MNLLTSIRLFLGDTAAIILAFALGVLFAQATQNLIAAVTGLTARLAKRFQAAAVAPSAGAAVAATPAKV